MALDAPKLCPAKIIKSGMCIPSPANALIINCNAMGNVFLFNNVQAGKYLIILATHASALKSTSGMEENAFSPPALTNKSGQAQAVCAQPDSTLMVQCVFNVSMGKCGTHQIKLANALKDINGTINFAKKLSNVPEIEFGMQPMNNASAQLAISGAGIPACPVQPARAIKFGMLIL